MGQSLIHVPLRLVFSTKDREPLIAPEIELRLWAYLGTVSESHGCPLLGAGGMPDHVHLLVSLSQNITIADLLREVKAHSSKWMKQTFPQTRRFAWQAGYGAFAVSESLVPRVKRYIASQPQHHARKNFQDEFRELLRKHQVEFDERYVWG